MAGITAEHIKLTAKLLEARDTLKSLLGPRYDKVIGPVRAQLQHLSRSANQSVLSVGQSHATRAQSLGLDMAAWQILAATVDLVEKGGGSE